MADSNEQEKLKITAELDTSKLKQQAQQGMNAVVQEEKKVEQQSQQTSKAVDKIGDAGKKVGASLQQAGNAGTQALKQMGNEAEKTAKKIAGIDTSVKNLKLGQAIGLVNQFANSDTGKAVGGYIGNQLGMSESAQGLAGSAIQGGLAGAATGAMIAGPWGAAVGGLVGAGAGLVSAAKEQEKAAVALIKAADERQAINRDRTKELDRQEAEEKRNKEFDAEFNKRIAAGDYKGAMDLVAESRKAAQKEFEIGDKGIRNAAIQMDATPLENRGAAYKSYDDYLTQRTSAKTRLGQLDAYDEKIKAAQEKEATDKAREAERAAQEAEKKAKEQEQAEAKAKAKADAEARAQAAAEAKFEKEKNQNWLNEVQDQANNLKNGISGMAGMKLSDSLTKIGGGAGYGAQMTGISNYVGKVVNEIKNLEKIAEEIKNTMKNNESGGVFISESE